MLGLNPWVSVDMERQDFVSFTAGTDKSVKLPRVLFNDREIFKFLAKYELKIVWTMKI